MVLPSGLCHPPGEVRGHFCPPPLCWEWAHHLVCLLKAHSHSFSSYLYRTWAGATVVSVLDVLCCLVGRVQGSGLALGEGLQPLGGASVTEGLLVSVSISMASVGAP